MKNSFIALLSARHPRLPARKKIDAGFGKSSLRRPLFTTLRDSRSTYQDDNTKLVEVIYPFQGATSGYKYLLVPKGQTVPDT